MSCKRIIGRVDYKGPSVVKGRRFEGLRKYDLVEDFFSREYMFDYCDEILLNNITGSLYGSEMCITQINRLSQNISIPLTVQGGIRSVEQVRSLLNNGASRVAINTEFFNNKNFFRRLVKEFGTQAIIFAPSVRIDSSNNINYFVNAGREQIPEAQLQKHNLYSHLVSEGLAEVHVRMIDYDGVNKSIPQSTLSVIESHFCDCDMVLGGSMNILDNIQRIDSDKISGISVSTAFIRDYTVVRQIKTSMSNIWEIRL